MARRLFNESPAERCERVDDADPEPEQGTVRAETGRRTEGAAQLWRVVAYFPAEKALRWLTLNGRFTAEDPEWAIAARYGTEWEATLAARSVAIPPGALVGPLGPQKGY